MYSFFVYIINIIFVMWYIYLGLYFLINKLGESLFYMIVFIGLNGIKEELGI